MAHHGIMRGSLRVVFDRARAIPPIRRLSGGARRFFVNPPVQAPLSHRYSVCRKDHRASSSDKSMITRALVGPLAPRGVDIRALETTGCVNNA
jgi:hypothetical protein